MPKSSRSTAAQLAEIRAGLLTPGELFARVVERFVSSDPGDPVHAAKRCRAASAGKPVTTEWLAMSPDAATLCVVLARTKSEARAAYKKMTGRPIPPGVWFRRRVVDKKGKDVK